MPKIGIIGDLHLKEKLGYADYVDDKRIPEKKEILDFIVKSFSDCEEVVFLGDQLNSRNNTSEVIRELVNFIECFSGKKIYIIAGNHEAKPDGKTAIDFLKEIENKNWKIFTNAIGEEILLGDKKIVFAPYFFKEGLDEVDAKKAVKKVLKILPEADILFHHFAISGATTDSGAMTDLFDEIVLPEKKLKEKYSLVVGGHIHKPQEKENIIVAGSIFNNEIGEQGKFIWKIDENLKTEKIALPGRKILKLIDPKQDDLNSIPKQTILKIELTKKTTAKQREELKIQAEEKSEVAILTENYSTNRKKQEYAIDILNCSVEELIKQYAISKKLNPQELLDAFKMIN